MEKEKQASNTLFERGYVVDVDFTAGKVTRTREDGTGEPEDFSAFFKPLVEAKAFQDGENSYELKFNKWAIELSFERTEWPTGPLFRITVADKARQVKQVLIDEKFEDLRYVLWNDEAELFRNGTRYETVKIRDFEKDIAEGILKPKKNFYGLEGPELGTASFRVANTANVSSIFTIRRLGQGFSFIDTYGDDLLFIRFFAKVLSGHGTNRSILVSGWTSMGKTSVLISLLNFMNGYSLQDIYKHLYVKGLSKVRSEYATFDAKSVTKQQLEKLIRETLPPNQAEIIIQGAVEYVKDSGLNRLLSSFSGRTVFSIEKPIERRFKNDSMSFIQTDVSFDDGQPEDMRMYERGMTMDEISTKKMLLEAAVALQSNPSLIYISEIKEREEYEKYLEIILQGVPSLATNHSGSIWQNLERIMSLYKEDKVPKQSIVSGMGGMLNLRRYDADDDTFLFSYEYLLMTDEILTRLRNTSIKEFEKVITISMMPDEYVSHDYSLIRQIYTRYAKTGNPVGIKTFGMPEYEELMSDYNVERVSKLYGFDFGELQAFQSYYIEEMRKREAVEV